MSDTDERPVTAALIIIGNEVLSGRTKDANMPFLAEKLNVIGIRLMEARVVRDEEDRIVEAVNTLRAENDYVFTTGGIGPTHDDITSATVAKAFGVPLIRHPEAERLLVDYYNEMGRELTPARMKMADVPEGAELVENPVSRAPGFRIGNVFVFAGVPSIMRAMFESVRGQLKGGRPMLSVTIDCHVGEGSIADRLTEIQELFQDVEIGSYPFFRDGRIGSSLVMRSVDGARVDAAAEAVRQAVRDLGGVPRDVGDDTPNISPHE